MHIYMTLIALILLKHIWKWRGFAYVAEFTFGKYLEDEFQHKNISFIWQLNK